MHAYCPASRAHVHPAPSHATHATQRLTGEACDSGEPVSRAKLHAGGAPYMLPPTLPAMNRSSSLAQQCRLNPTNSTWVKPTVAGVCSGILHGLKIGVLLKFDQNQRLSVTELHLQVSELNLKPTQMEDQLH